MALILVEVGAAIGHGRGNMASSLWAVAATISASRRELGQP